MLDDPTRPTSLTTEERTHLQATRAHFKSLPYYTASALEQANKRGCLTLTLEQDPTLELYCVTVLRSAPLMMWGEAANNRYLFLVAAAGQAALKIHLMPSLMADLYRIVRP